MQEEIPNCNAEEWRDIPNLKGKYQVSNLGRLRKVCPYCGPKHSSVMVPEVIRNGYLSVVFTTCGHRIRKLIHVLVAEVYIGPKPDRYDVNHLDGDKTNNAVSNLEYITRSDNHKHAFRTGIRMSKLSPDDIRAIRISLAHKPKRQIAREFGVSPTHIRSIANGQAWAHLD